MHLKVLFITQYFPPEPEPGGHRILDFSRRLAARGHDVTVITGMPSYPSGVVLEGYARKAFVRENFDGVRVLRGYVVPASNKASSKRLLGFGTFICSSTLSAALNLCKSDIVYCTSPPLFNGVGAYATAKLSSAHFLFEVRDLWPESALALGMLHEGVVARLSTHLESFFYQTADCIVTVTPGIRERLVARGFSADKIKVVTNGVDVRMFKPSKRDSAVWRNAEVDGKFVVTYAGTHGVAHGLEAILEAAAILKGHKSIRLVFAGDGSEKDRLVQLKLDRDLDNVVFVGMRPKREMPSIWAASDVCLISLRDVPVFRAALPTKMFEGMACGLPILLAVDGEARDLINDAQAGLCVEPGNARQIADAVLTLHENPCLRAQMGRNGRAYVSQHFSREILADKLEDVLYKVVSGGLGGS
jgi:glycosyltransferase involved in cell wall biosynthesis